MEWLPLMDYAVKRGVSLSTLRRHIKANKIQYRVENGRYLLLDSDANAAVHASQDSPVPPPTMTTHGLPLTTARELELEKRLNHAQEEIVELKTLIAFYEETLALTRNPK